MSSSISPSSETLIQSLNNSDLYDHEVSQFKLIETHISWVLLTGPYAYKIKKPVNLGFLDFSKLEQRRFFCEEELRLNQRLAPKIYLELVTITGTPENPLLNQPGEPIEYAVKMKQFPQSALLSHCIQQGQISPSHIDDLAQTLADFHARIAVADSSTIFGTPDLIRDVVMDNFRHMPTERHEHNSLQQVKHIKDWTMKEYARCLEYFHVRKARGFVRECHGDLHLGNIALIHDSPVIFDCIEFSARFRWIDVMSEMAFVVMDLIDRGAPELGWRLLNSYLEQPGDYRGLHTFRFYLTYRAMVRAKVIGIRLTQERHEDKDQSKLEEEFQKYLSLAESFTQPPHPILLITHGLSGTGKTTISQTLLESLGAIRLRSDIERKRMLRLPPTKRTDPQHISLVYSDESTQLTYAELEKLARHILQSGYSVIVDATFLKRAFRDPFAKIAKEMSLPFFILNIRASHDILRERVKKRLQTGHDASEADVSVLEQQFSQDEPFSPTEHPFVVDVDTEYPNYLNHALRTIQQRVQSRTTPLPKN